MRHFNKLWLVEKLCGPNATIPKKTEITLNSSFDRLSYSIILPIVTGERSDVESDIERKNNFAMNVTVTATI
jgi:hypothetical protein